MAQVQITDVQQIDRCNPCGGPDEPPDISRTGVNVALSRKTTQVLKDDHGMAPDAVQDAFPQMEHKTLNEMRAVAAAAASQRGHVMGHWGLVFDERSRFRFKSHCKHCHALLEIKNWKVTSGEAQRVAEAGFLIVQDKHAFSDQDHVIVLGPALIIDCWERPTVGDPV